MTVRRFGPEAAGIRMEKQTLQEMRGLRSEVSAVSRSQADLRTDQAAVVRDIHHMNLQMVDQAKSIREMANAVVKLAAVSEKMERANKDINELGQKHRDVVSDIAAQKEQSAKDKEELNAKLHAMETEQTTLAGKICNHDGALKRAQWLQGSLLLLLLGGVIKIILGD